MIILLPSFGDNVGYDDSSVEGVDIVLSPNGQLSKPTGEVGWCFECDCMMVEVHWTKTDCTEWICFSLMRELGEGVWQMDESLYG